MIINAVLAFLFVALSFTDFLDGYFARKYNQTSQLGAALDHIADKFLTTSTLIALLTVHKIYFFWVIIFIGRDLFIMGLRLIALEHGFTVPVGYIGKLKTASMMALITWIILNPYQQDPGSTGHIWQQIELILLATSILLTLLSAYGYIRVFIQKFIQQELIEKNH
jgi:CDP-diacylglycerol--glycerol-3-phosphate 3-phosphatidyltransferase